MSQEVNVYEISCPKNSTPSICNPFDNEDPKSLHESIISPGGLEMAQKPQAPQGFRWSINDLAIMRPAEISHEDVHRQALYMSSTRMNDDMEEERQQAIEEFFSKSLIVPSPWIQESNGIHKAAQRNTIAEESFVQMDCSLRVMTDVSCQTLISVPPSVDLESILAEFCAPANDANSSLSLRRKLFIDSPSGMSQSSSLSDSPLVSPSGSPLLLSECLPQANTRFKSSALPDSHPKDGVQQVPSCAHTNCGGIETKASSDVTTSNTSHISSSPFASRQPGSSEIVTPPNLVPTTPSRQVILRTATPTHTVMQTPDIEGFSPIPHTHDRDQVLDVMVLS
uniref:Protein aurora borealis n=1 Tax=Eptatretus burgeri TaxID=7764 RepID=A0A8C4N6L7_EPTBU